MNFAERQAKEKSTFFGDLPNQLSVNRVNPRLKLFIHLHPASDPCSQRDTPSTF
jgi:hypothetical protein